MVTIRKQMATNGCFYEIDDFLAYRRALLEGGIDASDTSYRIFISRENETLLRESVGEWEQHIKRFYQLGPVTNIPCEIIVSANRSDGSP